MHFLGLTFSVSKHIEDSELCIRRRKNQNWKFAGTTCQSHWVAFSFEMLSVWEKNIILKVMRNIGKVETRWLVWMHTLFLPVANHMLSPKTVCTARPNTNVAPSLIAGVMSIWIPQNMYNPFRYVFFSISKNPKLDGEAVAKGTYVPQNKFFALALKFVAPSL